MAICAKEIRSVGDRVLALSAAGARRRSGLVELLSAGRSDGDLPVGPLIDLASIQLQEAGLVTTRELPEELGDGQSDYLVELTDAGKALLASGGKFEYKDVGA